MKEKIIKFTIVALMAFFSASMACADTVKQLKYPYVERIEVGYQPQAFSLDSTATKPIAKVNKKVDEEEENKLGYGRDIGIGVLYLLVFLIGCWLGLVIVLGTLGIVSLILTKIFHKKR